MAKARASVRRGGEPDVSAADDDRVEGVVHRRRGDREAGVRTGQEDAGCGQGVEPEEAGGRQERADQEDTSAAPGRTCADTLMAVPIHAAQ